MYNVFLDATLLLFPVDAEGKTLRSSLPFVLQTLFIPGGSGAEGSFGKSLMRTASHKLSPAGIEPAFKV
jgi:hypothetical protein